MGSATGGDNLGDHSLRIILALMIWTNHHAAGLGKGECSSPTQISSRASNKSTVIIESDIHSQPPQPETASLGELRNLSYNIC